MTRTFCLTVPYAILLHATRTGPTVVRQRRMRSPERCLNWMGRGGKLLGSKGRRSAKGACTRHGPTYANRTQRF